MKWPLFISLAAAGWLAAACGKGVPPETSPALPPSPAGPQLPTQAQPKLRTIKLWLGAEEMTAEVAMTAQEITTGMMFRTNIETNAGMLFLLGRPVQPAFWMKNCPLPLSAAYIDPAGTILEMHELHAQDTNPVVANAKNVQYVLETSQGWFEQHHIANGTLIRTERGSFPKTFAARGAP